MVTGPGLYSDIGKKARDLLYKDYLTAQKFTITTYTADSVAITSSATKKNDLISGEILTQIRNKGVITDVKVNSDSSLSGTFTFDQLTPGLKLSMNVVVPESKNGKVDIQYLHESFGFNSSVGLNVSPVMNFAGAVGTSTFAIGADVGLDTATGLVSKYNAGVSYKSSDFAASVNLNDKGDTLVASYYHLVNPRTAVGAELIHGISSNDNTLTFGSQHSLDRFTTVKARLNNFGKASALIQHEWRPKSLVTLSSEVDTKAIEKSTKFGLALALKP